jgi:hypothetical protein
MELKKLIENTIREYLNEESENYTSTDKLLLNAIKDATGVMVSFVDSKYNESTLEKASEITFGWADDGNYIDGITLKRIKLPKNKSVITVEWVMEKLNKDSVYKFFSDNFRKLLEKMGYSGYGFSIYPTTYGIGVFTLKGEKGVKLINDTLDNVGILYSGEWSDAQYVYRYKISKSKENVDRMKKLLEI